MADSVFIRQVDSYASEKINDAVSAAFDAFGGVSALAGNRKRIIIKPNLVLAKNGDHCAVTHRSVTEAVICALIGGGVPAADITIAESPGGPYNELNLRRVYKATGMNDIAERYGVRLNYDTETVELTIDGLKSKLTMIKSIMDSDFIIDVCKLKMHGLCTISAAVKNLYGCIGGFEKVRYHAIYPDEKSFSSLLVHLCEAVKPGFSVVDAVTVMEGNGPTGGTPRHAGAIIAGINPYLVDYTCAELLGLKPETVDSVRISCERGLCSPESAVITGGGRATLEKLRLSDIIMPDTKRSMKTAVAKYGWLMRRVFSTRPVITEKCVGCGDCMRSCPASIITVQNKKAVIGERKKCIECYCCQELCPISAVEIKRGFGLKMFR